MSPKVRQYLLYASSICVLLAVIPFVYLKTSQEFVFYRQADSHFIDRDYEEAARLYGLAYNKGVDDPRLLVRMGDSFLALREFDQAMEAFHHLQSRLPDDLSVLIKLALVYALNDMTDQALVLMDQVLVSRPGWNTARLWRARILAGAGRFEEAIEIYYQVLEP